VVTSCGGGLYAHRYKTGSGFDNPSVYCADLLKIITHVQDGLRPAGGAGARPGSMHQLSGDQFDSLAAGYGDIAAVEQLATSQRSLQRKLLQLLRDCAGADRDGVDRDGADRDGADRDGIPSGDYRFPPGHRAERHGNARAAATRPGESRTRAPGRRARR
jgi:hypothetical protein